MAQNLFKAISLIRSHISNNFRVLSTSRCVILKDPSHRLNNVIVKKDLLPRSRPAFINLLSRQTQTNATEARVDVINNVILWKYDTTNYYRYLHWFSVIQLVILLATAYTLSSYIPYKKASETWKEYLLRGSITIVATAMSFLTAVLGSLLVWCYITRSLKYIILNKGGKMITFVAYHPFKEIKQITVPVEDVTVGKARKEMRSYMGLKIKNIPYFYIIERSGTFVNPVLFDCTIGMKKPDQ